MTLSAWFAVRLAECARELEALHQRCARRRIVREAEARAQARYLAEWGVVAAKSGGSRVADGCA